MAAKIKIVYCTASSYKREEWERFSSEEIDGRVVADLFSMEFRAVETDEPLLRDIAEMVKVKASSAYRTLMVPCIVEHAGIVLKGMEEKSYPGGLTQPMWDALGAETFVSTCGIVTLDAIARAVVGYCDGAAVHTFVGETSGKLLRQPKGNREFYWDPVFCPDGGAGRTYAEIVGDDLSGLSEKVSLSQSSKALRQFLRFRVDHPPILFP